MRHSIAALIVGLLIAAPISVAALSSANYQIQEDFIGNGGSSASGSSPNYTALDTVGTTAVGDSAGTSVYKTKSGTPTPSEPDLSLVVATTNVSLGTLTNGATATGTAAFSVINYTSYGYAVQIVGATPTNGPHNLTAISPAAASSAGTEQFGINLVANTGFGANPVQVPDSTFSFGATATGYNTANTYKYASGDTIALATKSSGKTNYTISYVVNVSNATPQGNYTGTQTIICTGTY